MEWLCLGLLYIGSLNVVYSRPKCAAALGWCWCGPRRCITQHTKRVCTTTTSTPTILVHTRRTGKTVSIAQISPRAFCTVSFSLSRSISVSLDSAISIFTISQSGGCWNYIQHTRLRIWAGENSALWRCDESIVHWVECLLWFCLGRLRFFFALV